MFPKEITRTYALNKLERLEALFISPAQVLQLSIVLEHLSSASKQIHALFSLNLTNSN